MEIFLALLVPIFVTLGFYLWKKTEFTWWEFFIPFGTVLVVIVISKLIVDYTSVTFDEYWGSTVVSVVEEEPYNYWKTETCSYTTSSTDSKGNTTTTTHYYDCSHQVDVRPDWTAYTNIKESFGISEAEHDRLKKQFGNKPRITETHQNYDPSDDCAGSSGTKFENRSVGAVSNVLQTDWNGSDETRKAYTSVHSYENKVKATDLSIFNISVVTKKQADSLGLFEYPKKGQGLYVPTILGKNIPENIQERFRRLNGKFGVSNEMRLWILVFDDKPSTIGQLQENYWVKGNMNEFVICIGRKGDRIMWTHVFSWATSTTLIAKIERTTNNLYVYKDSTAIKQIMPIKAVPLTQKIRKKMKMDKTMQIIPLDVKDSVYTIRVKSKFPVLNAQTWNDLYGNLNSDLKQYKRRDFKEFSYLTVNPSRTAVIIIWILAFIVSILTGFFVTHNNMSDDDKEDFFTLKGNNNYFNRY